jgi:hypothetical protein
MKRLIPALGMLLALSSTTALAHEGHQLPGEKVVTKTVTGELVDMGCYLGHAATGDKHSECALRCVKQGMPMGVLTSNGTLYLVTLDHDNADPYESLKSMAGKQVTLTGELLTRSGMKAIEATTVKLASK